jgi:hypothetical protein
MQTNGYDYAFALLTDVVNDILAHNLGDRKIEIDYNTTDKDTGTVVNAHMLFAPWSIVPGGGNSLINLKLPVSQGVMSHHSGPLDPNSYDLAGVSVIVQVELGWLGPGDPQQATGHGDQTKLVFSPSGKPKDNPGYVSPVAILDPNKQLDTIGTALLKATIVQGLVDHKDALQYIFADVNPTPPHVSSWLNPVKWQYYVVDSKSGPSALCFLSQLSDKPFPNEPTFDSNNLDKSHNALLLISQVMLFQHVVQPGVEKSFPDGRFTRSVDGEGAVTIENKGNFDVGKVTAHSYRLTTSEQGNGLAIKCSGGGPLKFLFGIAKLPNASYSWGISTVNPLSDADGRVSFKTDPHPSKTHDQTIHWYDWVLLVVLGITSLPTLISFIVDAVNHFYDQSDSMGLGKINDEFQDSVDGTVVNLAKLISWTNDGESFKPATAALQHAFYVRGDLEA